jgi:hypothetical protein
MATVECDLNTRALEEFWVVAHDYERLNVGTPENPFGERVTSALIQVRIGLVQYHERRIDDKGAGQRHATALSGG